MKITDWIYALSVLHVPDEGYSRNAKLYVIVLVHWNNILHYQLRHIILGSSQPFFGLTSYWFVLKEEAANTNLILFSLTRLRGYY